RRTLWPWHRPRLDLAQRRDRFASTGRRTCRRHERPHHTRWPSRSPLRSWTGGDFSCPKIQRGRGPDAHVILELLAPEKLGPFLRAASVLEGANYLRRSSPPGANN